MSRRFGPVLTVAMALVLIVGALAAASPPDPFRGSYESIDIVDASEQRLVFGGGGDTRRVTLFDADATIACAPDGGPVVGRGVGEVDGDTLTVELSLRCANGATPGTFEVTFTDNGDGTLGDSNGDVWTRP